MVVKRDRDRGCGRDIEQRGKAGDPTSDLVSCHIIEEAQNIKRNTSQGPDLPPFGFIMLEGNHHVKTILTDVII
jgi:hypothetical protein